MTTAPQQTISSGNIRITYLPDGEFTASPAQFYPQVPASEWEVYVQMLGDKGLIPSSIGAHVIQTGTHTILVDTGNGPHDIKVGASHLSGGELLESLRRVGLSPNDIDIVFYTHLHIDHVGWTGQSVNGTQTLTFPKARYFVRRAEWNRFDNPDESRFRLEIALPLLAPIIGFIEDGQELVPGIRIQATPGHTIGHAALSINAQTDPVLLTGDVFHNSIGIDHPEWLDASDGDPQEAILMRQHVLEAAAQSSVCISSIHLMPSTFGHIVADTSGKFTWQTIMS